MAEVTNTERNRSHWGEEAATYNVKFGRTIQQIRDEIRERREWIGVEWVSDDEDEGYEVKGEGEKKGTREVRLLDYACGTGLVSKALAPYITQCVGIDLTEGMVNEYNTSAHNQGIPESEMHAVQGNLLDPNDPSPAHLAGPEFHNFDIAVVGLGFHHFDDPALAAQRLSKRLKKGGVLMIVDFMSHDVRENAEREGDDYGAKVLKTVTHAGFSEEVVRGIFEGAGVGEDFRFVVVGRGVIFGGGAYGDGEKEGRGGHSHGHGHAHEHGHEHNHGKGEDGTDQMKRTLFMARGVKL